MDFIILILLFFTLFSVIKVDLYGFVLLNIILMVVLTIGYRAGAYKMNKETKEFFKESCTEVSSKDSLKITCDQRKIQEYFNKIK